MRKKLLDYSRCRSAHARHTYAPLLDDPKIKRWHANVARGSLITADVYLRRLGSFYESSGIIPNKLVGMDEEALRDFLLDTVTERAREALALP